MSTKVKSVERVFPEPYVAPGDYEGVWGGYVVEAAIGGVKYRFYTEAGVRGINIPCVVRVRADSITVETRGQP